MSNTLVDDNLIGDLSAPHSTVEPLMLIFGSTVKKQTTPSFVFLAYWDSKLDCWMALGRAGKTWSFSPWHESEMGDYKDQIQSICSIPAVLWEGIKYYLNDLGSKRTYSRFHKSCLHALWAWVKLWYRDRRLKQVDLFNAEMITRILRASNVPTLAGSKQGTITPAKLKEAILDLSGAAFTKPSGK